LSSTTKIRELVCSRDATVITPNSFCDMKNNFAQFSCYSILETAVPIAYQGRLVMLEQGLRQPNEVAVRGGKTG
jgi:hypothetical protein